MKSKSFGASLRLKEKWFLGTTIHGIDAIASDTRQRNVSV